LDEEGLSSDHARKGFWLLFRSIDFKALVSGYTGLYHNVEVLGLSLF